MCVRPLLFSIFVSLSFTVEEPCNSNPCDNDGTCIPFLNSYMCSCPIGWTGIHCQTSKAKIISCNLFMIGF